MIIEQLYEALREAGASEERSREAARAVADFQNSLHRFEIKLTRIEAMLAVNVIATIVGVAKLLIH